MEEKKALIVNHIKQRIKSLKELGKLYSEEKINTLAINLLSTNKPIEDLYTLIDNKFATQVRKIKHKNYLASLKEYYISSIDKLKKGNNCYLLSYDQGVKVLEQAYIEEIKDINPYQKLVNVNKERHGIKKPNSVNNDYELIMSDIAYLLNIDYARTYRIFDGNMNPEGVLNITFEKENERFLTLEETLRFIKEESPKFNLTQELIDYHDKRVKNGLKEIHNKEEYKHNIDYVLKIFASLPDITEENIKKLTQDYLNMKIFELLTNSLNNNLNNIGLIINKENKIYTYKLSPSYNKYTTEITSIKENKTICNFYIVEKEELLKVLIDNYYQYIKEILYLIVDNKNTLLPIIKQVIKEHLEFSEYNKYNILVTNNINMIEKLVLEKKKITPITKEDELKNIENNDLYHDKIAPFVDNYLADDYDSSKRGSTILMVIVSIVLMITIGIILLAIFAISNTNI